LKKSEFAARQLLHTSRRHLEFGAPCLDETFKRRLHFDEKA